MASRSISRRMSRPAGGCGMRGWRQARSSAYCGAGWALGIPCGWSRQWRCTGTRFRRRRTCLKRAWGGTQSWTKAWTLWGLRRQGTSREWQSAAATNSNPQSQALEQEEGSAGLRPASRYSCSGLDWIVAGTERFWLASCSCAVYKFPRQAEQQARSLLQASCISHDDSPVAAAGWEWKVWLERRLLWRPALELAQRPGFVKSP